jgi:hypothetical protein
MDRVSLNPNPNRYFWLGVMKKPNLVSFLKARLAA